MVVLVAVALAVVGAGENSGAWVSGGMAGKLGPSLAVELLGMLKSWQSNDTSGIPHPRTVGWDQAPAALVAIEAGSGKSSAQG